MKASLIVAKSEQITSFIERGIIAYIDYALAEQLLKPFATVTENCVLFLCHLSAAARQGHLCVIAEGERLVPSVQEIWQDSQEHLAADFYSKLEHQVLLGHRELPEELITDLPDAESNPSAVQTPLCKVGCRIYLQRFWLYETLFWLHYKAFANQAPKIQLDQEAFLAALEKMIASKAVLKAQAKAIQNAARQSVTIISGGPGTGKSYTAGQLVRIFFESLSKEQQETYKIALAAPTGKAAANLQKSLLKAASDLPALQHVPAVTLHRLLGIRAQDSSLQASTLLSEDLLIVDECSMIDMRLMARLFAAMKPGARLVLLGDKHQLPAVDAGAPFADLITMQSTSKDSSVIELDVCLRAELQEIVSFAKAIKQGCSQKALHFFKQTGPLEHVELADNSPEYLYRLCETMVPYYHYDSKLLAAPEMLFAQSSRFRALSPLKKGLLGVEPINYLIHSQLKKYCPPGGTLISPIIMLKNDHRLEIFNGEVGLLIRPKFQSTSEDIELACGDYALLPAKDGTLRSIPALLLPAFEYAYCLSVHKSQGSEFDHVLLLLPPGSEIFGREVLYTAVTRARRKLELWSSKGTLEATIQRKSYRLSSLAS